jgi:hypothetical protein
MLGQGSYQTLNRFIPDQTDAHETRVLQARGEKMDALAGAIDELHFDLSKIMLTELPGQTFETNQRLGRLRAERGDQRVEGSLASLIACFGLAAESPATLDRMCVAKFPGSVSGNSSPCWAGRPVVGRVPPLHRHASPVISRMDSMTNLPAESITATTMVA